MFESIGAALDKLVLILGGVWAIIYSSKNKEKLGDKAKWLPFAGIGMIVFGILLSLKAFIG